MQIICPQCSTEFNVPDAALGSKGRKVKCSQCGHVWRQTAEDAFPSRMDAFDEPRVFDSFAASPRDVGSKTAAVPMESPSFDDEPEPVFPARHMPMEQEPVSSSRSRPSSDAFGMGEEDDDPLAGLDLGETAESQEELAVFGKRGARGDAFELDGPDLDDLLGQDPEPIPEMFARTSERPRRPSPLKRVSGVFLGLVLTVAVVGAIGYFGRQSLVRWLPALEPYYAQTGIPVDVLGLGLQFRSVTSERLAQSGVDTLVVRGFVANVSDRDRDVPFLRMSLFDATDALVQEMVSEPPVAVLKAGETTGFRIAMENPSAAARRFEVDWTKQPTGRTPSAAPSQAPAQTQIPAQSHTTTPPSAETVPATAPAASAPAAPAATPHSAPAGKH